MSGSPARPGSARLPYWLFPAVIERIIDGDTFDAAVDLGFEVRIRQRFRLLASRGGVDTPEINSADPGERAMAGLAKARVMALAPPGTPVAVRSEKGPRVDGFRRWLAEMVLADGRSVGDVLLDEGLASVWTNTLPFHPGGA